MRDGIRPVGECSAILLSGRANHTHTPAEGKPRQCCAAAARRADPASLLADVSNRALARAAGRHDSVVRASQRRLALDALAGITGVADCAMRLVGDHPPFVAPLDPAH